MIHKFIFFGKEEVSAQCIKHIKHRNSGPLIRILNTMTPKTTNEEPIPGKTHSNCQPQAGISKSQHMKEQQSVLDIAKTNRTLNEHSKAFLSHRKVIKISTYNVRTLKQPGKLHQLIDGCINNGIDLVAVQEHRWQTQEQVSTHLEYIDETTWRFEYSSATIEGQGGVGLLISPKLTKYLSSTDKISDSRRKLQRKSFNYDHSRIRTNRRQM